MADFIKSFRLRDQFTFPVPPIPDALTTLGTEAIDYTTLRLSWVDPGLLADSYSIQLSADPLFMSSYNFPGVIPTPGAAAFFDMGDPTMDLRVNNYYVRIRAVNTAGFSAWTTIYAPIPIPDPPINLTLNVISAAQINANFDDPGIWAASYDVDYSTSPTFSGPYSSVPVAGNPLGSSVANILGLVTGTTYYVRVRATNAGGSSAYSATQSATTL